MDTLDEVLALLDTADWQLRFVAAATNPGLPDEEAIVHLHGSQGVAVPSSNRSAIA